MSQFVRLALWPMVMLLSLLPTLALADLPARVGRLADIENGVNFRVDRSSESGPASLNWPISSGALLDTEWRGRAEVWIGSSAYRVAGNSEVEFVQVDDQQIIIDVVRGSLAVSIMDRDQAADLKVTTPEGQVRFTSPGRYRIDVLSDHSEVTTQAGQAIVDDQNRQQALMGGQKARLYQGQRTRIDGDFDQDNFDSWVADRENATIASTSRRHVSPQMTGYQDLDANGDWRPDAEYGTVWYPRTVADDWAPYRFGRWAWVAPWGWTWIDQAPWGFAPFHYGRWVMIHNRWAWTPGRPVQRPVYAPALVGWIGNPGWSVSFNFGSAPAVGWFPLAPREVYVPAYRYSPNYIRQININHVQNIRIIERAERPGGHEEFAHRHEQRAVTVVPASLLREGRVISSRELRQPDRRDLERAPQFRQATGNNWLAPTAGAIRPHRDERRDAANDRSRWGDERPSRQFQDERTLQRRESAPVAVESIPIPVAPPPENRREMRENRRSERFTPREDEPPVLRQREASPPAREMRAPPPALPVVTPPVRSERQAMPPPAEPVTESPRGLRDIVRRARETQAETEPPPETSPVMPSIRALRERSAPPPAPVAPPPRHEERQVAPTPEREQRRELREIPRGDRGGQQVTESPAFRQREATPPPAVRPPPAQPAAAPQAQPAPQPIREAPKQEARPEQRSSDRENRRRDRHDDKEERGPR
jgi:hypothetical protein